jgi:hypothetical protein
LNAYIASAEISVLQLTVTGVGLGVGVGDGVAPALADADGDGDLVGEPLADGEEVGTHPLRAATARTPSATCTSRRRIVRGMRPLSPEAP